MQSANGPARIDVLVSNHRAFLGFLERRLGDHALAEDVLQEAFRKVIDRPDRLPPDANEDTLVKWFYRSLRNAAIDQFRRKGAAARAAEAFARELDDTASAGADVHEEICACITRLASTLKAEYAEALQKIDVEGTPVKTFATERQLSASNAGVRVFRAREALKKRLMESCGTCAEHGCRDCHCGR
jgi:RNA polymerase sigma factor (sigma-70 family)